ncbi:MAG: AmmeMemoRadiSam system protein B [Acidobacteria bacterium]|nr:AmmeMemoRadiSam system protein B [Acidobacteriota bacterium]
MATVSHHRSPLAGTWYPEDAAELRDLLALSRANSVSRTGSFLRRGGRAFLVPHAAPLYSGTVAAATYRHVQAAGAERVIILGFSHRRPIHGVSVPILEDIETPLGSVPVDRAAAGALAAAPPFHAVAEPLVCDHSVEIQIPFLQTFLPGAAIVPLYVGHLTADQRRVAAARLREHLDARTILLASSDLTHFGYQFDYLPFEPGESTADDLRALDMGVLAAAGSLDADLFAHQLSNTRSTVCGSAPIELMLETIAGLGEELYQETLDYDTSGAIMRDYRHSVSYGAAGYFPASAWWLEPADQTALLAAARFTLEPFLRNGRRRFAADPGAGALSQPGRAFVSLYEHGELRGCVGCFEYPQSLIEIVPRLALDALADRRFARVADPDGVEIEVHVLTPPRRIADPRQLRPGEHGAYLKSGARQGLLLPVVAEHHGFSRSEFLRALARKAGLPDTVYMGEGWELSLFRDQRFQENRGAAPPDRPA